MRKLIAFLNVGYAGMDAVEAFVMPDDATDGEINEVVWEFALANAEMYGYYPPSDDDDQDDEYVSEGIDGHFEDYRPEHDSERAGGGSFEDDFADLLREEPD